MRLDIDSAEDQQQPPPYLEYAKDPVMPMSQDSYTPMEAEPIGIRNMRAGPNL
jgi:hypothetical protein